MSELATRTVAEIHAGESQALAKNALDAIQSVKTPDEAEVLLARVKIAAEAARVMHLGKELSREWRNIEIKAERKWGELLGKADRSTSMAGNKNSAVDSVSEPHTVATAAERTAVKEARKLAAVPEEVFEEYVETAVAPSKAGLLREASARTAPTAVAKPEPQYAHCPTCGSRVRADKPLRPQGATT